MKEKNRNQQAECYVPVIVTQIVLAITVLALFLFLKSGEKGKELSERFSSLMKEDFLTYKVTSAVSGFRDYLMKQESVFAVLSDRVEIVETTSEAKSGEEVTEEAKETTEPTEETTKTESAEEVLATIEVSEIAAVAAVKNIKAESMTFEKKEEKTDTKEQMIFPVEGGRYTSYFGERTDPISEGADYHNGVDIGADEGDEILAVYDGTVSLVGEDERSGKYIFLSHDDSTVTFYCHCSEILLSEGDKVKKGDVIALVGSTGYSTGPHLHFELRIDGESTDPMPLLEDAA